MTERERDATLSEASFLRHLRDLLSPPAGREPYTPMTPFERETLNSIGSRLILLSATSAPSATASAEPAALSLAHDMAKILQIACDADEAPAKELLHQIAEIASKHPWPATPRPSALQLDPGTEKLLRTLLDRAYKMLLQAGYRVMEHAPNHNDPIIAWMSDARHVLYGSGRQPDLARLT